MEGDVVLAHEIERFGSRIIPPFLPLLRLTNVASPLDAGCEITHHRLKPDIYPFLAVSFQRQPNAPFDIAGDGAAFESIFEVASREVDDGGSPVVFIILQIRP